MKHLLDLVDTYVRCSDGHSPLAASTARKAISDELKALQTWRPIETAPEDENILVATKGGYVDTAFWTDEDGEGRKWWWLETANKYVPHPIPDVLQPTHWMPLPKHPDYKPETAYEKSARWAWPDGRPDL